MSVGTINPTRRAPAAVERLSGVSSVRSMVLAASSVIAKNRSANAISSDCTSCWVFLVASAAERESFEAAEEPPEDARDASAAAAMATTPG